MEHPRLVSCPSAVLGSQIGDRAWRCALPNGHELVAVMSRRWASALPEIKEGMAVQLEISPADFGQGRIVGLAAEK